MKVSQENSIAAYIRRWELINANQSNYGKYEMRELIRDIESLVLNSDYSPVYYHPTKEEKE